MEKIQEFNTRLVKTRGSNATVIHLPFDSEEVFGGKHGVKVRGKIDNIGYRSSIFTMHKKTFMVVNKSMRDALKKEHGDNVHVIMGLDKDERTIDIPADMKKLLKINRLYALFNELSYTHRKEYVQWVESSKKLETRHSRLQKAIKMIKLGTQKNSQK